MITVQNKTFKKYISQEEIQQIIADLAERINKDYEDKEDVLFLVVLNGAFMFAADLFKRINGLPLISFVKLSSYTNTSSSGNVKQLIGLNEDLTDKNIIIVEDIVDSGITMGDLLKLLKHKNPESIEICTLMFKPNNFRGSYNIKYVGKEITDEFIIGYGFDLNGIGRNLPDIYQLQE
ncbi:MAG: hypoxanthine phosphoribosyltransferase [Bacteroidales bacterium]|nr:hypoxanthine phosphoribosyltransferase [Bacteroidales bacterium]